MQYVCSGVPLEVLAQEFWVPGSLVRAEAPNMIGKQIFREILDTTDETACLYASRACEDCLYLLIMPRLSVLITFNTKILSGLCSTCQSTSDFESQGEMNTWESCKFWSCRFWARYHQWIKHQNYQITFENCDGVQNILQKAAQLTDEQHYVLFDVCCLWLWLRPKLAQAYPAEIIDKHDKLFQKGCLGIVETKSVHKE